MNHVSVTGNLGKDPLIKTLNSGIVVCEFSISERLNDKESQWHNIKCFKKTAEFADKHCFKGQKVLIYGHLKHRIWEDRDGKKKYSTEIIANTIEPFTWKNKEGGPSAGDSDW